MALVASVGAVSSAAAQAPIIEDGRLSFVISHMSFGLSDTEDASVLCPDGLTMGPADIFRASPEGSRREGETDADYTQRLRQGGQAVMTAPNGQNLCMHPEAGEPDPHHRFVTGDVASFGIDLDGQVSRADGEPAPGACAHNDFRGVNGESGVDNQFLRAVGCTNTLGPGGAAKDFYQEMLTGSWGVLITVDGVDNLVNDDEVEVGFYDNADPIQLSPAREALMHATYANGQNPRFHATARGRIVDGVLTTDPVDVRFRMTLNAMHLERFLRDARLRMTINSDGAAEGVLAGYSPVEGVYDTVFGFRDGRSAADGELAAERRRAGSASGYAYTARHTCNGVYYALHQMADGHPDPETGRCTSISTQYRIGAVPAFVVDVETQSVNQELIE